MIKVVVYDCDGVIVDSRQSILSYYDWMTDKCGLPRIDWSEEDMRQKALSMADRDILEVISGGDEALYRRMLEIAKNDEKVDSFENMSLETGLLEGLNMVRKTGLPAAVLTNRGKSLHRLLEYFKIENLFSMLVTAADVSNPKPSPEGLLKICGSFGAAPGETLFIGDSPTDYHAAKTCGARFVSFKKPLWDAPVINDHRMIANLL